MENWRQYKNLVLFILSLGKTWLTSEERGTFRVEISDLHQSRRSLCASSLPITVRVLEMNPFPQIDRRGSGFGPKTDKSAGDNKTIDICHDCREIFRIYRKMSWPSHPSALLSDRPPHAYAR